MSTNDSGWSEWERGRSGQSGFDLSRLVALLVHATSVARSFDLGGEAVDVT